MSVPQVLRRERDLLGGRIKEDRRILEMTENDASMLRDRIDQSIAAIADIDAALSRLDPDNHVVAQK